MRKKDFWELFRDTGDPVGYLLYRGAPADAPDPVSIAHTAPSNPAHSNKKARPH